jgi:hypothetical protein
MASGRSGVRSPSAPPRKGPLCGPFLEVTARLDDPAVEGQPGPVLWHDGGTGGFRSVAGFVAESATRVVVLSNSSRPSTGSAPRS